MKIFSLERFVMFIDSEIHEGADNPYVDVQIHEKVLPLLNNLENKIKYFFL